MQQNKEKAAAYQQTACTLFVILSPYPNYWQRAHKKSSVHNIKSVMNTRYGAGKRTWTSTTLRSLEPDGNATSVK